MSTACYEKSPHGIYLKVKVIPRASRSRVLGIAGGRVRVAVRAVPQNGAANEALEEVIAAFFQLKKSCCKVTFGHKTSLKTIFIAADVEQQIKTEFLLQI
jgi:uncharacterized protein YggU (UPF0235/DUF167 family)